MSEDGARAEFFENVLKGGYILPRTNNNNNNIGGGGGGDFNVCHNPTKDLQDYVETAEYIKVHRNSMASSHTDLLERANGQDSWDAYNSSFYSKEQVSLHLESGRTVCNRHNKKQIR